MNQHWDQKNWIHFNCFWPTLQTHTHTHTYRVNMLTDALSLSLKHADWTHTCYCDDAECGGM